MSPDRKAIPVPMEAMNEAYAKKEAAMLAQKIAEIKQSVIKLSGLPTNTDWLFYSLTPRLSIMGLVDGQNAPSYHLSMSQLPINVVGDPQVYLHFDLGHKPNSIPASLGMNIRTELSMGFHTDRATLPAVEKMLTDGIDLDADLGTSYYFSLKGKFAKTSLIPAEIQDDRDPLVEEDTHNMVLSPMGPRDFELAELLLHEFQVRVDEVVGGNFPVIT